MKIIRRRRYGAQLPLFRPGRDAELPLGLDPRPEMVCFRGQTLALVRHYFELSCQVGRLPSLMGREVFRARVSHHAIPSFEEQIVFLRDLELCLGRLRKEQAEIMTLVGLHDLPRDQVAAMLGCSRWWINDQFARALDALSEIFLQAGLLDERRADRWQRQVLERKHPRRTARARKKPCAVKRPLPAPQGSELQSSPLERTGAIVVIQNL